MLLIDVIVKKINNNKGLGIICGEFVPEGKTVFVDGSEFHKIFTRETINRLPKVKYDFIIKYATYHKKQDLFYLDLDDMRFINHSKNANLKYEGNGFDGKMVACKDIEIGQEITVDYTTIYDNYKQGVDFEVYN